LQFSASPTTEELFRARVFQEPLVVVGGEPTAAENSALAAALLDYSKRSGPDDFSALTDFLQGHPQSPWTAALLTDLGLEYYNTAHYSLAIDAWSNAWALAKNATDRKALALVDRAFGELIHMDARLGRMDEIETLLKSVGKRPMLGPAAQRVVGSARGAVETCKPSGDFLSLRAAGAAEHPEGAQHGRLERRRDIKVRFHAKRMFLAASGGTFQKNRPQLPDGLSGKGRVCRAIGGALESRTLCGPGAQSR
jgi:hypothetical protein